MVHQDTPHHRRGKAEKVRPIAPVDALLAHQPEKRLVDDRRGLQRMGDAFAAQLRRRDALELAVDAREERFASRAVAASPGVQEPGDVRRLVR